MNSGIVLSLLTLHLCFMSVGHPQFGLGLFPSPFKIIKKGLAFAEYVSSGIETGIEETVGHIVDTIDEVLEVGLSGLTNCLANGSLQCIANHLPTLPDYVPAGPILLGPYGRVCTCLTNLAGCYIDAAKPPGRGFTCTCVKQEGLWSGRNYGCTGLGYRLAWDEESTGGTDDLEQCRNGASSYNIRLLGVEPNCEGYMEAFSEQTWAKIQKDVKIRLFAPNSFRPVTEEAGSDGSCGVWEQGEDIYCKLQGGNRGYPQVRLPSGTSFNPR